MPRVVGEVDMFQFDAVGECVDFLGMLYLLDVVLGHENLVDALQ